MDKLLADGWPVWREQIVETFFNQLVIGQFPELAPELRQHAGVMHLQTAAIAEALMDRVAAGQIQEAVRILVVPDQIFATDRPATAIESALQFAA